MAVLSICLVVWLSVWLSVSVPNTENKQCSSSLMESSDIFKYFNYEKVVFVLCFVFDCCQDIVEMLVQSA